MYHSECILLSGDLKKKMTIARALAFDLSIEISLSSAPCFTDMPPLSAYSTMGLDFTFGWKRNQSRAGEGSSHPKCRRASY
jgi:hypothetical protein